ncbi:MAG: hypothetical protein PWP23_3286 [Candidatus Sumerlaeota bacterium]|nr:hypothetical protein [Candidatus Sumerlaeota bacterium]
MARNIMLEVKRDEACENLAGIQIEGCSAIWDGKKKVEVIGEAAAKQGTVRGSVALQITVYGGQNQIIGRSEEWIMSFGLRQSFEVLCELKTEGIDPTSIRIFPTKDED